MKIVILGSGDVGTYLAEKLNSEGHQISIVDKHIRTIEKLSSSLDILAIHDSCLNPEALNDAGIKNADMVIAVTDSDETNLISCLLTKEFSNAYTIARVKTLQEKYGNYKFLYSKIGVNKVINSDLSSTNEIMNLIQTDYNYNRIMDFAKGKMELIRLDIKNYPHLQNKSLLEIKKTIWNYPFMITLVIRKDSSFIPKGDFVLTEDDSIYVMINNKDILKLLNNIKAIKNKQKKIIIMGGGNITLLIAQKLEESSIKTIIIENNPKNCEYLADKLMSTIIIKGDATELSTLLEEGIQNTDIFIATGSDDKNNLLGSLLAKNNGAKKTICLMRRPDYVTLVNQLGIDHIVAPRVSVSNDILKHIRGEKITYFYALPETDIEIIEHPVIKECMLTQNTLKNIAIPESLLIGGIIKNNNKTLIPSGDYQCSIGDKIIFFARDNSEKDIQQLLA
jgi:trk system potassium uptake protein